MKNNLFLKKIKVERRKLEYLQMLDISSSKKSIYNVITN